MAAAKKPGVTIRLDDITDITESLRTIENEAASYGELKSAVVEYDDFDAVYADREWTLHPKEQG
jgi:hypothetical protein